MKTLRVIAAAVLAAGAGMAAYYSYKVAFAPPPMHATSSGPPAGISMPKMGGPSPRDSKRSSPASKSSEGATKDAAGSNTEKGGDAKPK